MQTASVAPGMKLCPVCRQQAALAAPECTNCGHTYRTAAPSAQPTVQAAPIPVTVVPPMPVQPMIDPREWGPRDLFEFRLWAFFHWAWFSLSAAGAWFSLNWFLWGAKTRGPLFTEWIVVTTAALVLSVTSGALCVLRLRRLYCFTVWRNANWGWNAALALLAVIGAIIAVQFIENAQIERLREELRGTPLGF